MSFKGRHSFGMSSSRKPWGKDDKAKHGKHSAALIESRNNLTGGGASKQVGAAARNFSRNNAGKVGAVLTALLAVILAVSLAMPAGTAFAAEKSSDGNTTGSYSQNLGDNSSTRYAGRVWTDKTVYTDDATFSGDVGNVTVQNDSDFLVAYSALATTQNITGKSSVPVDVVFVIDNSNSMDDSVGGGSGQSRLAATVEAVNTSIATIMESHPDSRVAVVLYGSSAHTLMPLGHYSASTSWQHNGDYVWYESDTYYSGYYDDYVTDTTFGSVANNRELEMGTGVRGTNIHMGVDTGLDILKSANDIGEGASKHVPALILLSDGAATYSGSDNWWNPSGSEGTGSETNNAHALKVAMNAQYNKQQVNEHYGIEDSESSTACKIYTIGMGIEQLNSGRDRSDYYRAQMALDPGTHLTDNNDVANAIEDAWDWYINGKEVQTGPFWDPNYETTYTPELDNYTFRHPSSGDISTIAYNDGYYSAENAEDVTNVFDDITSEIVSASAQAPTQIEGGDPLHSGYLTYTDPIGEYMEVKDIKSIIYGGEQFTQKSSSSDGNTTTYTFTGDKIESPVYGELDVSLIEISVTKDGDGNETLTVKIPAAAIPLRVNTVDIDENGAITNTNNNAYPARILYTVGAREDVNLETLEGVSDDYISANMTEDGQSVNFYSNKYSGNTQNDKTVGDAKVTFTAAETNPFFYVQENTPLYTAKNTNSPARNVQNDDTLYYFQITYYEGNEEKTEWVSRPGSTFYVNGSSENTLTNVDGQANIKQGAPRLGYLTDFAQAKSENTTNTAEQVFHPVYDGNGQFTVYLGNNGVLKADAPKSLTVEKDVTAGEGLTAPDADFTFEVTVATKADTTGDAILTDADGQTTDKELTFDAGGKTTFTLKDGQSMEILNIGEGVDYTVKEINLPAGFTSDQTDNTKTGTVSGTDEDNVVKFTNTYNVAEVTTDDLGITLGGTKSITGRDFQADDEFVFTIARAQATPNAPLPAEDIDQDGSATTATVNPTSGDKVSFEFGDVTFTKPGEYRYVIRETTGTLPGIDYDGALYRVNIIVQDNGDGTLSLASVDGGLTGAGDVNYPTNPFIQVWDGEQDGAVVGAVAFENNYSATSAEATIQGTKVLNSTNSDRILADDDFTFTIEALGCNTDGGDQFNQVPTGDPEQPMPVNTEVNNVANGNVIFGEMTFTQDMIGNTYGYKITEKLPQGVDENNPTLNGVTYDTSEKIVKVTVTRSDEGGEEHVVATVTPNDGTAEAAKNFTFTNTYEPSSITIGEDTNDAITVQKTFTGRTWNDSDTFEYTLKALDGASAPDQTTLNIGKPASGTSNTETFGDITFEKEGTYKYEITETKGNLGGVDYDEHTATVTVTVTEDEDKGTLSAEVSYDNTKAENASDQAVKNAAAFTNTYKATFDASTTVNLNGKKELTGKSLTDNAFYFIVDPQETASGDHAPTGESVAWNPNKADGSIQLLKNVTYTEAGEYVYIIKEQIPSNKALGMTYDESEYRVTVTVTDDQQGNLKASEPKIEKKAAGAADYEEADAVVFKNSYEPLSGTYTPLKITKVLSGDRNTALAAGEFSFEMSVDSANPEDGITLPQQTTVENAADGTVQFGNITFTKPGTYVVQVKEVVPADGDKVAGVTYDDHVIKSTFTVTDVDGQLTVNRTSSTGSQTFTNTYKTTGTLDGVTNLEVTKSFTGRDNDEWLDTDSFGFKLEAADEATTKAITDGEVALPDNATSLVIDAQTADHKAAFGDITFNAVGEYTFKVTEVVPADEDKIAGVIYDDHEATITVTTTDNGDGTLKVTPQVGADALTFTNTYEPSGEVTVGADDIDLSKVFEGAAWDENFSFDFTIEASEETPDAPMPDETTVTLTSDNAEDQGDGTYKADFGFGPFTFDELGDYKYIVKEKATEDALGESYNSGIKYDNHEVVITISVTDNKQGGFATSVSYEGETTFNNTYAAELDYNAAGGLVIEKTLVDHDIAAGQFEFTVTGTNDAAKALLGGDGTKIISTKGATMGDSGNAIETIQLFDDMVFTHTHDTSADPEYTFTVKETTGGDEGAGYTNDDTEYTVTINVIDDKQGGLTVETKVTGGSVDKTYTYSNDGGETENAVIPFTNTYEASGSLGGNGATSLSATKVTNGRDMTEGEFDFTVTAKSNVDQNVKEYATGSNVAAGDGVAGAVNFSEIKFTKESLNEDAVAGYATYNDADGSYTYVFTVAEETDGLAEEGITPTASSFTVNVVVTDNNDGTLSVAVTYPQDSNNTLAFVNTYEAEEVPLTITGKKQIDNGGWADAPTLADIAGKYTFTLTGVDEDGNDAPLPGNATDSVTANNDASGSVDFGTITYTLENVFGAEEAAADTADVEAADVDESTEGVEATEDTETNEGIETYAGVERSKTFTYTIEEAGDVDGISNDEAQTFKVTVTDNGQGKLTVATDPAIGSLFSFTNTYSVTEEGSTPTDGSLTLSKTLTGRDMSDGEFSFEMVGTSDNAKDMKATGVNAAAIDGEAGSVALSPITFKEPGTYEFQIREVNNKLGGVDYDASTLTAKAEVSSDGAGKMLIEWTVFDANGNAVTEKTFNNTYTAKDTSVVLGGTKVLDGRALAEGEFQFKLADADGNEIQTVSNDAKGGFTFDKITYSDPGEYSYIITEVAPADTDAETEGVQSNGVTYDTTTYNVKVVVEDDLKGNLKITQLTYNDEAKLPVFTNTYTAPAEPEQGGEGDGDGGLFGMAKTGDFTGGIMAVLAAVVAAAAAGATYAIRKMRRPRGRHAR